MSRNTNFYQIIYILLPYNKRTGKIRRPFPIASLPFYGVPSDKTQFPPVFRILSALEKIQPQ